MTGPEAARAYAALYGSHSSDLALALSDVGIALASQLDRLSEAPDPIEAEAVARNLEGAARAVMRLREALLKEQEVPDGSSV